MSSDNQGALLLLELYLPKPEPVGCVPGDSDSSDGLGGTSYLQK